MQGTKDCEFREHPRCRNLWYPAFYTPCSGDGTKMVITCSIISKLKMQLDIGSEPYLSTAWAFCLFSSHNFYYKTFTNWQRIQIIVQWISVRQWTDRWQVMPKSLPYINTGGLKMDDNAWADILPYECKTT